MHIQRKPKIDKNAGTPVDKSILAPRYRILIPKGDKPHNFIFNLAYARKGGDKVATEISNEAWRLSANPRSKYTNVMFEINKWEHAR